MQPMKKPLPQINGAEQLRLTRINVIGEIEALRNDVVRRMTRLQPASIMALAMSRHPEQSAEQAFATFRSEVAEFLCALETCSDETQVALNAAKQRLAPIVAFAAHRGLDLVARISNIDARINANQRNDAEKRKRLRNAGLKGDELESVASTTDNSELLAQRAAMVAENEALQRFLRTRDEQHLPEGFANEVREAA
jgi:hypothetical protein